MRNIILVIAMTLCCIVAKQQTVHADSLTHKASIMVSLGDSYSSGEGVEPFYGETDDHIGEPDNDDWLAHRSEKAWVGQLVLPDNDGKTMAELRDDSKWFFVAASGATSDHFLQDQTKNYNHHNQKGSKELPAQFDVFDTLKDKGLTADYVTLTIGGNDVGFTNIIGASIVFNGIDAVHTSNDKQKLGILGIALSSCHFVDTTLLTGMFNHVWDQFENHGIKARISNAYGELQSRASNEATILVAGYPELVASTGSVLINAEEAKIINENVSKFNDALEKVVNKWHDDYDTNIYFVSVEDAFAGHGNGSDDPYINPIMKQQEEDLVTGVTWKLDKYISAYSMHPNEKGVQAYAQCVQAKIDELEQAKASINDAQEETGTSIVDDGAAQSPTDIVARFFSAIQSADMKATINCFDPSTIKALNFALKYAGDNGEAVAEAALLEGLQASGLTNATLIDCQSDSALSAVPLLNQWISTEVTVTLQYADSTDTTTETLKVKYCGDDGWRIVPDSVLKVALLGNVGDTYE